MKTIQVLLVFCIGMLFFSCVKETKPDAKTETPSTPLNDSAFHLNPALLLQLVNDVRQVGCTCGSTVMPAVPALAWNSILASAADTHSIDMNTNSFLSHTGSDGSSPADRITAAGYVWQSWAENIASGYTSEQAVMNGWLGSEPHCKNIMSPNIKELGVAREGNYWTQDFGTHQ
ncbi:MAG: CAP domain-containing protein [Chitinophagales bacterium]